MNIKINLHVIALAMVPFVMSACTPALLSHEWRDPSFVSDSTRNILVIAIRKNQLVRQAWENDFTAAISGYGIKAVPAYRLFPDSLPDANIINTIAGQHNFDRIVLLEKISIETKGNVTPGFYINTPAFPSQPHDQWCYAYYDRGYYPGYPVVENIVKDEIKVWSIRDDVRLIWAGASEAQVSGTREDVRDRIIQLIVSELVKRGVIASGS